MTTKKKKTYRTIGSVLKSQDGQGSDYIKIRENITLNEGECLRLESKQARLDSLEAAVAAGKLTEEYAAEQKVNINKIPEFVRFNIVQVKDAE